MKENQCKNDQGDILYLGNVRSLKEIVKWKVKEWNMQQSRGVKPSQSVSEH